MTENNASWHEARAEILLSRFNTLSPNFDRKADPAGIAAAAAHAQLAIALRLDEARRPIRYELNNHASEFVAAMLKAKGKPPASAA